MPYVASCVQDPPNIVGLLYICVQFHTNICTGGEVPMCLRDSALQEDLMLKEEAVENLNSLDINVRTFSLKNGP